MKLDLGNIFTFLYRKKSKSNDAAEALKMANSTENEHKSAYQETAQGQEQGTHPEALCIAEDAANGNAGSDNPHAAESPTSSLKPECGSAAARTPMADVSTPSTGTGTGTSCDVCLTPNNKNEEPKLLNESPSKLFQFFAAKLNVKSTPTKSGGVQRHLKFGKNPAKRKPWYKLNSTYRTRALSFRKHFGNFLTNDERLLADFSCALQRDVPAQGRIYVSQNHLCFHSNIFGYERKECIPWTEVTAISKDKTALIIPNAISIATESQRYFFLSFITRDKAFRILFLIWQHALNKKSFAMKELRAHIHNHYGSELELNTDHDDADDDEDDVAIDPYECDEIQIVTEKCNTNGLVEPETPTTAYTSIPPHLYDEEHSTHSECKIKDIAPHREYSCSADHSGRLVLRLQLRIDVATVFKQLFTESEFMKQLHALRNNTNVKFGNWKATTAAVGDIQRTVSMIVPVNAMVGAKSAHVIEVQTMRECTVPCALYSIDVLSSSKGVPYADYFTVETHYCLERTNQSETLLSVNARISFKKSVWSVVKTFIEKFTWDGIADYFATLQRTLESELNTESNTIADISSITDNVPTKAQAIVLRKNQATSVNSNLLLQQQQQQQQQNVNKTLSLSSRPDSAFTSILSNFNIWIIILLCFLVILNCALIFALYIEFMRQRTIEVDYNYLDSWLNMSTNNASVAPPNTEHDMLIRLQKQELVLKKALKLINAAVKFLKSTETALEETIMIADST